MSKFVANKYGLTYQEDYHKLPWYERDMMSYIDHVKYKTVRDDPDQYFDIVKVVNFDIIKDQCRGDKLVGDYKDYKTIKTEDLSHYPKNRPRFMCQLLLEIKETTYGLGRTSW